MIQLSIVVPTFNECDNVRPLFHLLESTLEGIAFEVIYVDDDSTDGTYHHLRAMAQADTRVRVIRRVGRRGLASACIEGMMSAAAPFIAVMDADLQHDETILPEMLRRIQTERLDIVIASRNITGGSMGEFAEHRQALSSLGAKLSQVATKSKVSDPMSGFFLLRRKFLDEVIYEVSGVGFKILLDLLASSRRPVNFAEVPYQFRNRQHGESKLDAMVMIEYLELLLEKATKGLIPASFIFFAGVGAIGSILHLSFVLLLWRLNQWDFTSAYMTATLVAITSNFLLNNAIAFRNYRLKGFGQVLTGWLSFLLACSFGAFLSSRIAQSLIAEGNSWIISILCGIFIASLWNYAITRILTWKLIHRFQAKRRTLNLASPESLQEQDVR